MAAKVCISGGHADEITPIEHQRITIGGGKILYCTDDQQVIAERVGTLDTALERRERLVKIRHATRTAPVRHAGELVRLGSGESTRQFVVPCPEDAHAEGLS